MAEVAASITIWLSGKDLKALLKGEKVLVTSGKTIACVELSNLGFDAARYYIDEAEREYKEEIEKELNREKDEANQNTDSDSTLPERCP